MKWKVDPPPKLGDVRIKKSTPWLPCRCKDDVVVWFSSMYSVFMYQKNRYGYPHPYYPHPYNEWVLKGRYSTEGAALVHEVLLLEPDIIDPPRGGSGLTPLR